MSQSVQFLPKSSTTPHASEPQPLLLAAQREEQILLKNKYPKHLCCRHLSIEQPCSSINSYKCVVCLSGKASLQTFPCGHMVALDERQLPLRCIICRSRIVRLKQQFSSRCRVAVRTQPVISTQPMFSSDCESSSTPSSAIRRPGYC
ncbi:hypothetical protein T4E_289 [Trichinella pseudospiralis]|uniref:RING-type domain-containing protein n=1 Tax=Trichinella pseudospiralis TaxID=6337 RepID=A0A0V0YPW8_TRIPS|nr:hypothetical protein T4E_289 [Trichinella pseudospiralis]